MKTTFKEIKKQLNSEHTSWTLKEVVINIDEEKGEYGYSITVSGDQGYENYDLEISNNLSEIKRKAKNLATKQEVPVSENHDWFD